MLLPKELILKKFILKTSITRKKPRKLRVRLRIQEKLSLKNKKKTTNKNNKKILKD